MPSDSPVRIRARVATRGAVDLGARGVDEDRRTGLEQQRREPAARDVDAVAVDEHRERTRDPGFGAPAHRAVARVQAGDGAVIVAHDQDTFGRAQAAGEAVDLPERAAGRGIERAHGAVAGGNVHAAGVGGERSDDVVVEQRLPRRQGREERRLRRGPRPGAGQEARGGEAERKAGTT